MQGYLILENGSVYTGTPRGEFKETIFDLVFNTSMSGYIELFSDPAYAQKGVIMTYPMIGNYGISFEDFQSDKLQIKALLVHSLCDTPSNFRNENTIDNILCEFNIPCLEGIDTRALVQEIRTQGAMKGMLTHDISDIAAHIDAMKAFTFADVLDEAGRKEKEVYHAPEAKYKIGLLDYGCKKSVIDMLTQRGCDVYALPYKTTAEEIITENFDALILSNGPGNPEDYQEEIEKAKILFAEKMPLLGLGFGHQLLAVSQGAKLEKMSYARGGNYPTRNTKTQRTYLTPQSHGITVKRDNLPGNMSVLYEDINHNSVEGLTYHYYPAFSVQFHPEANAGPKDTQFIFDRFIEMIGGNA